MPAHPPVPYDDDLTDMIRDEPDRREVLRPLIASVTSMDLGRFEGRAGLRCMIGIAIPLLIGLVAGRPSAALFGGFGAFGVGFGSFQGAYRSRATPMLLAALSMSASVFLGSLVSQSVGAAVLFAGLWGFGGGLLVALGQSASYVGLQAILALLIAGGLPADVEAAAARAAFVLGGGLMQTLLVVMIWPLRRFPAERRSLARVYKSMAEYAAAIPERFDPPEPHTIAGTVSPLLDPQPFASTAQMLGFKSLLDEAERIRASLAAFAFHHQRSAKMDLPCAGSVPSLTAKVLEEVSEALSRGREPRALPGVRDSLLDCATKFSPSIRIEPLIAQLEAAWRTAGQLAASPRGLSQHAGLAGPHRDRRALHDAVTTLRANLSFDSTAFRHALRLAAAVICAQAIATVLELPRGHWVPLTVAVMLKPDFQDTVTASITRVGGTILGVVVAVALAHGVSPGSVASVTIILGFAWAVYALAAVNLVAFTVCLTGYVVFLLSLMGEPQGSVAVARITSTAIGGAVALCAYAVWPTWNATGMREVLATMLEKHSEYLHALLMAYADPGGADVDRVDELRAASRRARSNGEAIVERTFAEPFGRRPMKWRTAMGTLAANRRITLAALALRAGLQIEGVPTVPEIAPLAEKVRNDMHAVANTIRGISPPPAHVPGAEVYPATNPDIDPMVREEIGTIVDGVEAIAVLLRADRSGPVRPVV